MNLSDLGGTGEGKREAPYSCVLAEMQPVPHGERSSKGLFAFWLGDWTTLHQATSCKRASAARWVLAQQNRPAGSRAMRPKGSETWRLSPTSPSERSHGSVKQSAKQLDHPVSFALLTPPFTMKQKG
jgi:hypothetical protein